MMETIKGLCRAEGFMIALAAMVADRELCGDQRDSKIMQEARYLATRINHGVDFIIGEEKEIKELREELEMYRNEGPVESASSKAVEDAGR